MVYSNFLAETSHMKHRIAIVTGASSGIGAQTGIRLVKDFTGIVLVARRGELLQQTAEEMHCWPGSE